MENNEIIKGIETSNKNILQRIISESDDIFGDVKKGIVFKLDFGNEDKTNYRIVSFPIKDLEQAIDLLMEIDKNSKESEYKIRQVYSRNRTIPQRQLYLNCHFRRTDSY